MIVLKRIVHMVLLFVLAVGMGAVLACDKKESTGSEAKQKKGSLPMLDAESVALGEGHLPGFEPKIVNGEDAKVGEFPWQVSLVRSSVSNNVSAHFCGGSLIKPRWVVTAAHCVNGEASPEQLNVLVGTIDLRNGGQRIQVLQIIIHSQWDPTSKENDIALLKLSQDVPLAPLSVITPQEEKAVAKPDTDTTIIGWGHTKEGGKVSPKLQKATVPIVDRNVCNSPDSYNGKISENMLCAGMKKGDKDSCQADSGGPLVVMNKGGHYLLTGIVSWGRGCARPYYYGVYTRVANYSTWVLERTL